MLTRRLRKYSRARGQKRAGRKDPAGDGCKLCFADNVHPETSGKKRACHGYTCAYIVCAIMAAPPADREIALLGLAHVTQGAEDRSPPE